MFKPTIWLIVRRVHRDQIRISLSIHPQYRYYINMHNKDAINNDFTPVKLTKICNCSIFAQTIDFRDFRTRPRNLS